MSGIDERTLRVGDLDMAILESGPADGPLVLCLHGFPDCATGWTPLLAALADRGYHAVAPFMRGYAPTAVPPNGLSPIGAWVADVIALDEALGGSGRTVLVGHDWGALATYGAAGFAPDRWPLVVTASVPPPAAMAPVMTDYDQLKRFWYQYFFLTPNAEAVVAADDLAFVTRLWGDWSPGFDAADALGPVRAALGAPANLTAALSTYRCMLDLSSHPAEHLPHAAATLNPLTHRTLYLHGATDGCIDVAVARATADILPPGSRVEILDGAGHFLQYEQPDALTRLVVDFITAG